LWNLEPGGAGAFGNEDGITVMVCSPTKDQLPKFREDLEGSYVRYFADLPDGPDLSAGRRVSKIMGRLDMSNIRRRVSGPGVALVGDAAQTSDSLVGVGCGWALQSGEWLATALDGALSSDRDIDRALSKYRRQHRRELAVHHWMISDYSSGRPLNPLEKMLFKAAPHDEQVAHAVGTLFGRMETPQRIFTPGLLARIGWVSARQALTKTSSA
jgi:flavin-dependent dehydrogenase